MKIVLAGGTGLIGTRLTEKLSSLGHDVVLLVRRSSSGGRSAQPNVRRVPWDGKTAGAWYHEVDGADAVVNFAGESIGGGRWTSARKRKILLSRLDTTGMLVEAVHSAKRKPSVLVNASGVGYYGDVPEGKVTESTPPGNDFLAQVCEKWEREASAAGEFGVRVVLLRSGVVLAPEAAALRKLALPFKLFVGGPPGSGRQWFPWIHIDDLTGIVVAALDNKAIAGPVNAVAPEPVTMRQFCNLLAKTLHRPSWIPVPSFVLKLVLGEMSGIILTGQCAVPTRLLSHGYTFLHPKLDGALTEIFA